MTNQSRHTLNRPLLAALIATASVAAPTMAQTTAPAAGAPSPATPSASAPLSPSATAATASTPGAAQSPNGNASAPTTGGVVNLRGAFDAVSKSAPVAPAQPITLTLAQAIDMTLKASTALDVANRNLDRDEARIQQAQAQGGPRVGAKATAAHYDAPTKIAFGASSLTALPQDTALLELDASLPIDISGQIRAQTDVAKLQALADRFARDTVYNDLVLKAQTAYFGVLRAQHQVQVAEAALANAQAQQTLANQQYTAGTGQRIDVLRANTQVANARQNLTQAKNTLAISQINFNDTVGRPLNAPTGAVDVPGVTTGVALAPTSPNGSTGAPLVPAPPTDAPTYFRAPIAEVNNIDIDKSIVTATDARPDLRQDLVNVRAAERSIKLAKSALSPSLTIGAGGQYNPTTSFSAPRQRVAVISATLNFPLYDSGYTKARVREANDTVENAKAMRESHVTDVAMQVRQSYLNLQTAAQQIDAANVALQQAVAAKQLAQTRFQGGVGLYLEVTDAEQALTSAETNQVNAVYNYLTSRAQFQNALGAPELNPTLPNTADVVPSVLLATPPTLPDIQLLPAGNSTSPKEVPLAPKAMGGVQLLPAGSSTSPKEVPLATTPGDVQLLPAGSAGSPKRVPLVQPNGEVHLLPAGNAGSPKGVPLKQPTGDVHLQPAGNAGSPKAVPLKQPTGDVHLYPAGNAGSPKSVPLKQPKGNTHLLPAGNAGSPKTVPLKATSQKSKHKSTHSKAKHKKAPATKTKSTAPTTPSQADDDFNA
ncbi:MAG TPA: TolC family protein [Capsulimonadaceae bacterium]